MKDASWIGEDGESHPRRILRSCENRASKLTRLRSDHVVDGESHPEAVIPLQQREIIRRYPGPAAGHHWALIEQRRIAAGMTHAQLAARAGPGAVTGPPRLWTDNDHDAVPLGLLERLCQVLDLHPAELFQPPARAAQRRRALPPSGPPGDETVLEAALATVTTPSGQPGTPITPAALADALG